jgi:hypothetical protein
MPAAAERRCWVNSSPIAETGRTTIGGDLAKLRIVAALSKELDAGANELLALPQLLDRISEDVNLWPDQTGRNETVLGKHAVAPFLVGDAAQIRNTWRQALQPGGATM